MEDGCGGLTSTSGNIFGRSTAWHTKEKNLVKIIFLSRILVYVVVTSSTLRIESQRNERCKLCGRIQPGLDVGGDNNALDGETRQEVLTICCLLRMNLHRTVFILPIARVQRHLSDFDRINNAIDAGIQLLP